MSGKKERTPITSSYELDDKSVIYFTKYKDFFSFSIGTMKQILEAAEVLKHPEEDFVFIYKGRQIRIIQEEGYKKVVFNSKEEDIDITAEIRFAARTRYFKDVRKILKQKYSNFFEFDMTEFLETSLPYDNPSEDYDPRDTVSTMFNDRSSFSAMNHSEEFQRVEKYILEIDQIGQEIYEMMGSVFDSPQAAANFLFRHF